MKKFQIIVLCFLLFVVAFSHASLSVQNGTMQDLWDGTGSLQQLISQAQMDTYVGDRWTSAQNTLAGAGLIDMGAFPLFPEPAGNYSIYVDSRGDGSNGVMYTTYLGMTDTTGDVTVGFDVARRTDLPAANYTIRILSGTDDAFNGLTELFSEYNPTPALSSSWSAGSVSGSVGSGAYLYLQIEASYAASPYQTMFDNLTVSQVPEPATMVLLGLGSMALIRRKK